MTRINLAVIAEQVHGHGQIPGDWTDRAGCTDRDVNEFFIGRGGFYPTDLYDLCEACPVRLDCLSETLEVPGDYDLGFRGGLPPRDRDELRRMVATLAAGGRVNDLRSDVAGWLAQFAEAVS